MSAPKCQTQKMYPIQAVPGGRLPLHPPVNDGPEIYFNVVDPAGLGPGQCELDWLEFTAAPFRCVVQNNTLNFELMVKGGVCPVIIPPGKSTMFFWNGHQFVLNPGTNKPECAVISLHAANSTTHVSIPDTRCISRSIEIIPTPGSGLMTIQWPKLTSAHAGFIANTANRTDADTSRWAVWVAFAQGQWMLLAPGTSAAAQWEGSKWTLLGGQN